MNAVTEMSAKGNPKTTVFGDLVIESVIPSNNPEYVKIKLVQETKVEYSGGAGADAFALQGMLGGNSFAPTVDTRTSTQQLKASVYEANRNTLGIGAILPGFIQRIRFAVPQWEGHTCGADGFYYKTRLVDSVEKAKLDDQTNGAPAATVVAAAERIAETINS